MNFSGYVGHVTIFSGMFTIACCLVVGSELRLGLGLDLALGRKLLCTRIYATSGCNCHHIAKHLSSKKLHCRIATCSECGYLQKRIDAHCIDSKIGQQKVLYSAVLKHKNNVLQCKMLTLIYIQRLNG